MAVLVDAGAREKLNALFSKLEERIPEEALRPTAEAMAQDAAKRAPSPQKEYDTMMYGGWNASDFKISRSQFSSRIAGLQGAITDTDDRVRFYKANELYLKNYVPASFGVNGLNAWIGDIPGLNAASAYTYVNYYARTGLTYQHEVNFPFWEAWENGGVFRISPHLYGKYPHYLKPIAGSLVLEMTKTIPATYMYGAVDREAFVNKVLIPNIRKIARSV